MIILSNGVIRVGWQASGHSGAGEEPEPGHGQLGRGAPGVPPLGRDLRLPGFVKGAEWDTCPPSAALAAALEAASGPDWRCPGATRDEMFGLLRQWQAVESWAAAGKLGVLRALIRDDDEPLPGGGYHGDLPDGWTKSLTHRVALGLSMPAGSADKLMWLAWNLGAVLPGTGALLAGGDLTLAKARAVDGALNLLSGEDAAAAESMIVAELPDKTYGQVQKLAVQAALTVDPESAARRREDAERNKCRVQLFREETGAAGLSGRDLPTDQTLAAHAHVCARAQDYQDSGAFADDTRMDQYRATAYLDLLNGIQADARIALGQLDTVNRDTDDPDTDEGEADEGEARRQDADEPSVDGRDCACRECDGSCLPADDVFGQESGPGDDDPDDGDNPDDSGGPGGKGPDNGPGGGGNPAVRPVPRAAGPSLLRLADLVLPLATLLGLAERPGEGHGLGPLNPDLCRGLAIAATGSPWTRLCVTVTDAEGTAIGHGCANPPGRPRPKAGTAGSTAAGRNPSPGAHAALTLPARVNLTITAGRLAELAATGPPGTSAPPGSPGLTPWSFTSTDDPGPPGGYGTWTLTLPGGRSLTVDLEPVPALACDHRHESHAYQPNDTLRHLVQVRDYECTFPPCSRHARESDFEHATPYDQGGRTCACNAGARSRACHQVKQSPGWKVTQPKPGWHQWETPEGRVYTQGPKRYPT
jgi:Domain of unknown function (DUF222)